MKATNTWYVYIVVCAAGTLYTGSTTDVRRRVEQHNAGLGAKYTRIHRPVTLVHTEVFPDRSSAAQREYAIKQLSRREKLKLCDIATDLGTK